MSSNVPSAISPAKSASTKQHHPVHNPPNPVAAADSFSQRRSGGSGSFGVGSSSRATTSPRHNQLLRKQHKASKRPKLADEDAMAESAALRSSSSRKGQTSITHLMNFALPPRPQASSTYGRPRNYRRNPTRGLGSGYHAIDKARYIHANYRFVVDPRGSYQLQSVDADVHLDWDNVMQILVSARSQYSSCPICLGTPVAPRMSRCGHIFCLPCLLRYMHSEDEEKPVPEKKARWKPCPLCWDHIYVSETRPVRWFTGQEPEPPCEGADIVLRLVRRAAGSTLALPRDGAARLEKGEDIPWCMAAEVMDYARVMKGSEDYMDSQFDKDIADIIQQGKEDELMFGDANIAWTRRAVKLLGEAKAKVIGIGNPPTASERPTVEFENSSATADAPTAAPKAPEPCLPTTPSRVHRQHGQGAPPEYYFYHALLHYYLEPLDIRILKAAFGDFATFPSTILPRVEHISTGHIVDDDLRRQKKYLAHLPFGCEVAFLQCDWTDTVAPEVLEGFKEEIEARRARNRDKEIKEERARIRAEKEEDKRWLSAHRKRPSISERFSADDFRPLVPVERPEGVPSSSEHDDRASSSPPNAFGEGQNASSTSSSASHSAPRTVWGTAAVVSNSPTLYPADLNPRTNTDDGWLRDWEDQLLRNDDHLVAQAQALSLGNESSQQGSMSGGTHGGGKKKKAKKITLMSTNVRRGA